MYKNGDGVGRDYVEACAWWNIAAKTDPEVAKSRDLIEKRCRRNRLAKLRNGLAS